MSQKLTHIYSLETDIGGIHHVTEAKVKDEDMIKKIEAGITLDEIEEYIERSLIIETFEQLPIDLIRKV